MLRGSVAHFEIVEKIGSGGMGIVYKARDTRLDRFVALKVLPPDRVADQDRKRRFVQEAKAATALNHPNIVVVHDLNESDGVHFIVMEYVAGKTLQDTIPRKGLRLNTALKYAIQIADALAAAHNAGIVHRDLKPGNIMVMDDGRVKVLDFGLAKLAEPAPEAEAPTAILRPQTAENVIVGTVAYMSPEQAQGYRVDARSDIFSFGSVLYEMITGQRAFRGDSPVATLSAILHQQPKPPGSIADSVPPDLEKIVARCMRKDVERRFQTMADVLVELREVSEESESGAALQPVRRGRRPWFLIAGAVAAVALVGAWALWRLQVGAPLEPALTATPLTTYPGLELAPSFSPDGNQVAFMWNGEKQDNPDIYVKLIGPGPPLRLTSNPNSDMAPAWSPDGRWIAFRRRVSQERAVLLLIPSLGGPERTLSELASVVDDAWDRPAWSPDGKWIAFTDQEPQARRPALFVLSLSSGQRRRITNPPEESRGDRYPAFSPDGRTLAFSRLKFANDSDLFTIPFSEAGDSQSPTGLTSQRGIKLSPVWTGDGKEIVYSNVAGSQIYSLWRVRGQGDAPAGPRKLAALADATLPAIAPAARRLAYTRRWRDLEIYRVQLAGGAPARFISSTRSEENPRYSPDGKKIAFRSDRSGDLELWVSDSDGSNAVQLSAFGGVGATGVNWSPDGRHIAFRSTVHGHGDVYVIGVEGGAPQRITTEPSEEAMPAWSRDGKWLYLASNRSGTDQVWKMPSSGGPAVQVTRAGGVYSVESPDGKFLYYTKIHGPRSGVWRMPASGGEETRVLESVRWSGFDVSEEGIYFTPADGPPGVRFLRFTTGRIEPVVRLDKPTAVGLSLSPDRRSILFAVSEHDGSDLMLVENFR